MPEEKSPLDQAVELLVYAPVGLALTARDELPTLIAKGRERVTGQLAMAKMFGQFAVAAGQVEARKQAERLVKQATDTAERLATRPSSGSSPLTATPRPAGAGTAGTAAPATAGPATPGPVTPGPATARPAGAGAGRVSTNGHKSSAAVGAAASAGIDASPVVVADLAIPGYDTLSASQVVQRLGGLSGAELEAVRRYETLTRGRRTILSKVAQLQTEP